MRKLILASNSPRRKELLALFGCPFEVTPADIDEGHLPGERSGEYVSRLALEKANTILPIKESLVVAADTIVVDGGVLLGKPVDVDDARLMLRRLRGRTHQVYTGIVVRSPETKLPYDDVCCTDVPMRSYSDAEIEAYIRSGDPLDKAGAYAIQHKKFQPVEGLMGCYASVMGLPLCHLAVGLEQFGFDFPPDLPARCQALLDYDCPVFSTILGKK